MFTDELTYINYVEWVPPCAKTGNALDYLDLLNEVLETLDWNKIYPSLWASHRDNIFKASNGKYCHANS